MAVEEDDGSNGEEELVLGQSEEEESEVKLQLGNLYNLVREHGSLADAVQASLTSGGMVQGDLSDLRSEMNSFSDDIRGFAASAKMSSEMVLSIISRIREKTNSQHQATMRSRLKILDCGMSLRLQGIRLVAVLTFS